jgi:hypothetical protein
MLYYYYHHHYIVFIMKTMYNKSETHKNYRSLLQTEQYFEMKTFIQIL